MTRCDATQGRDQKIYQTVFNETEFYNTDNFIFDWPMLGSPGCVLTKAKPGPTPPCQHSGLIEMNKDASLIVNAALLSTCTWPLSALCRLSDRTVQEEDRQFCQIHSKFSPSSISLRTSFLFFHKKIPQGKGQEVAYLFQSRFHKYQSET